MSDRSSEPLPPPEPHSAAECKGSAGLQDISHCINVMINDYGLLDMHYGTSDIRVLTSVCHISHSVFKSPYNGVQHKFKLGWWDGQECWEAVRVHSLKQVEEMRPVLWVLFKILNRNINAC